MHISLSKHAAYGLGVETLYEYAKNAEEQDLNNLKHWYLLKILCYDEKILLKGTGYKIFI